jgi:hypothetical protein
LELPLAENVFTRGDLIMKKTNLPTTRCLAVLIATLLFCQPLLAQDRVFFGNLHSHSSYSDGSATPREAFTHARNVARLDFMALTEHNHREAQGNDNIGIGSDNALYNGAGADSLISAANALTANGQFVALYGQEFSTISKGNHVNVFDIREVISVENGRFDRLLQFLLTNKDSFNQPAVVMLNHPKNTFEVEAKEYGRDDFATPSEFVNRMGKHAALIQMINGPGTVAGDNVQMARPDERAYLKYLQMGFKVAPTADQDNHHRNWGSMTPARTAVIAPQLTKAAVLDAMRKRHVYATEDKNLKIVIKVNNHLCGDIVSPLPAPGELQIRYRIEDADERGVEYAVQVFRGTIGGQVARIVNSVTTPESNNAGVVTGTIEDVAAGGQPEYFFFKIIQFSEDGDEDRAWTAPVWFQRQQNELVALADDIFDDSAFSALEPLTDSITAILSSDAPRATAANTTGAALASRKSNTYHISGECLDAQRIKPGNLLRGSEARRGRRLHEGCPRTTGAP